MNMHIIPVHHWVFVHGRHFGDKHQENYYLGKRDNDRLYHHSKPILTTSVDNERNTRFFKGPEVNEVRKASGRDFKPVTIRKERSRTEKTYTTPQQSRTKPQMTERSTPKPAEREIKVSRNTRSENVKINNERTTVRPKNTRVNNTVNSYRKAEIADRNSYVSKQQTETKPKSGNRPPVTRTTVRSVK